jgi:hypothetical protein
MGYLLEINTFGCGGKHNLDKYRNQQSAQQAQYPSFILTTEKQEKSNEICACQILLVTKRAQITDKTITRVHQVDQI